uniref:AP-3 complex subunit delta-1 n=1 Tax=Pavo cristatus TaxID=9049 RepID=A0A8C9FV02_PAVCR
MAVITYVYLFHYICQDRIIYLCITDDDFERSRAFNFLNEIKKRFQTTYGSRAQTALPYAMNSEFSSVLAAQLVSSVAKWDCLGKLNFSSQGLPIFFHLYLKYHAESAYEGRVIYCFPCVFSTAELLYCFCDKKGLGLIVMHSLFALHSCT